MKRFERWLHYWCMELLQARSPTRYDAHTSAGVPLKQRPVLIARRSSPDADIKPVRG